MQRSPLLHTVQVNQGVLDALGGHWVWGGCVLPGCLSRAAAGYPGDPEKGK